MPDQKTNNDEAAEDPNALDQNAKTGAQDPALQQEILSDLRGHQVPPLGLAGHRASSGRLSDGVADSLAPHRCRRHKP